ncbi:solute carrier family 22 member 20-like isoform X2 [Homarus americanus]|uniref:solute carrier family 22 member 20-like isoform X2 n=1 Tax=Homarus americanus TaxID=6706 RepID=UPI001C437567|nr:solute carrier family 22 member 20-like isoform X2 [Homarus americanus]
MSGGDSFDDLLSTLGFGRWQLPSLMVTVLAMSQFSVHLIGSPLLSAPLAFRCSILPLSLSNTSTTWSPSSHFDEQCLQFPTNTTTTTATTLTNTSTDINTVTNITTAAAVNVSVITPSITTTHSSQDISHLTTWRTTSLPSCPLIQYDTSVFTSTVISEWDLVCERATLQPLFQTLFTVGGIIGSILGGHIGDRWGRRRAVVGACAVNLVVVLAMALTPLYPLLITLRFVAGCSVMAMLVPAWSLTLESTPAGCRSRVGMLLGLPFSASTVLLAVVGCFIREWRILLLVCSSPILILLPVAFMTDESPRWLVQQARMEEATRVMHKALQQNKVQLTAPLNTLMEQLIQESKATSSGASHGSSLLLSAVRQVWSYLRAPAMRTIIIVTPILWFLQSCLYLGVLINANNFTSTDPFLYLALSGLMEAVAIVVITPLTGYLGRRVMVWAGLALGGALLMLELLVPEGQLRVCSGALPHRDQGQGVRLRQRYGQCRLLLRPSYHLRPGRIRLVGSQRHLRLCWDPRQSFSALPSRNQQETAAGDSAGRRKQTVQVLVQQTETVTAPATGNSRLPHQHDAAPGGSDKWPQYT